MQLKLISMIIVLLRSVDNDVDHVIQWTDNDVDQLLNMGMSVNPELSSMAAIPDLENTISATAMSDDPQGARALKGSNNLSQPPSR